MSITIPFANDGKLGVDVVSESSPRTSAEGPEFALGTQVRLDANRAAIYVKYGEAVTYSSSSAVPVAINASFTASASAGGFLAYATYAAGEFGWAVASASDVS
jgi:hypothetical protein